MIDLEVLCKRESVKQMSKIINININELARSWLLAPSRTGDELLQASVSLAEGDSHIPIDLSTKYRSKI